jgi:hypothetical protein
LTPAGETPCVPALPLTTAATLLCAPSALEAFLSSTGTSLNLTPEEQADNTAVSAKIHRLRLIMKKLQKENYR